MLEQWGESFCRGVGCQWADSFRNSGPGVNVEHLVTQVCGLDLRSVDCAGRAIEHDGRILETGVP